MSIERIHGRLENDVHEPMKRGMDALAEAQRGLTDAHALVDGIAPASADSELRTVASAYAKAVKGVGGAVRELLHTHGAVSDFAKSVSGQGLPKLESSPEPTPSTNAVRAAAPSAGLQEKSPSKSRTSEDQTEGTPSPARQLLSSDNFPTPRIALRNNLTLADVGWFAAEQADAANVATAKLDAALAATPEDQWPEVFAALHDQLVDWRYQLAITKGTASSGGGIPPQAARFRTPITDETPNIDPVGSSVGFWHNGYKWDEALGRHAGGEETPASRLVAEVGDWVNARFDEEGNTGDVLQNRVTLPDGRQVDGTSILRGEAAHEHNRMGIERAKAKGIDTSQYDVNGDFIYIKTATDADREVIRQALYDHLSQLEAAHQRGETVTVRQWAEAANLFYQSPENKKGSDSVHRVYLMTLASRWGHGSSLPTLPDDVDWRAYVKSQDRFVDEIVALNTDTDV